MSNDRTHDRIHEYVTNKNYFNIDERLNIGKLLISAGNYTPGKGASSKTAVYLDVADARPLMADLSWGKPVRFTDFKGSPKDGAVESRVLNIYDGADKQTGERIYFVKLSSGPGQIMGKGAVKPAGEPTEQITIVLKLDEARRLALATLEYLQSWTTARLIKQAMSNDRPAQRRTEPEARETKQSKPPARPAQPRQPRHNHAQRDSNQRHSGRSRKEQEHEPIRHG